MQHVAVGGEAEVEAVHVGRLIRFGPRKWVRSWSAIRAGLDLQRTINDVVTKCTQ